MNKQLSEGPRVVFILDSIRTVISFFKQGAHFNLYSKITFKEQHKFKAILLYRVSCELPGVYGEMFSKDK